MRTLQTARITFEDHLPYNSKGIKWIAHDSICEELGTLLCNKHRPLGKIKLEFPEVDYMYLLPYDEDDAVWNNHVIKTSDEDDIARRETTEDMSHRAYKVLVNFLHPRPEREIAVVGHSAWLLAMTGAVLDIGEEEEEDMTSMFGQAEMRSMELIFLEQ